MLAGVAPVIAKEQDGFDTPAVGSEPQPTSPGSANQATREIIVTASRSDPLGKAGTASVGTITASEVALRPIYRPGQLFESIPGLVVTVHSGEGKASQYLIRGYNLDHGTDFANFVDDMPVNRPTNAHGQGYSDLSFLIPQIVEAIDFTKGPYYAAIGDFGSVASAHTRLADLIPVQLIGTVGTDGYQNLTATGALRLAGGNRLLGAVDLGHFDGPWQPGQNFRKVNAVLRFSQGAARDGFSLTGMFYQSAGLLTTDQPLRAIESGLISRFGTLDPSDASQSFRASLSVHFDKPAGTGQLAASLYAIYSTMTLWNNFTHYLDDPLHGDQEQQDEDRTTLGGAVSFTLHRDLGGISGETVIGLQARHDHAFVDRRHTLHRTMLGYCELEQAFGPALPYTTVDGFCNADRVQLLDLAPYIESTLHWTPWLRTVTGLREEFYHATDTSVTTNTGTRSGRQWLFQPKASLVLGPWSRTELYVSYGVGFHSNDVRGAFGTVPGEGVPLAAGATPLLAKTTGEEIGLRSDLVPKLSLQLAIFQQDFGSELVYNPDIGQDQAGAPSRRQGIEVSAQYNPLRWLELNTDLAFSKPRYRTATLAAFGLAGPYIADAPNFIYSAGILVDNLGPWSGGLQWRRLGTHHLSDGNASPEDQGYSEFNLNVAYAVEHGLKLQIGVFNLFNSKDNAADFYYTSRLPGEPAAGVAGFQVHPLEPRSARFSITKAL